MTRDEIEAEIASLQAEFLDRWAILIKAYRLLDTIAAREDAEAVRRELDEQRWRLIDHELRAMRIAREHGLALQ